MRARGKRTRAEPVAALYEQGRVSHVGAFPELEDEMCTRIGEAGSPDRLDALVWAVSELVLRPAAGAAGAGAVRQLSDPIRRCAPPSPQAGKDEGFASSLAVRGGGAAERRRGCDDRKHDVRDRSAAAGA